MKIPTDITTLHGVTTITYHLDGGKLMLTGPADASLCYYYLSGDGVSYVYGHMHIPIEGGDMRMFLPIGALIKQDVNTILTLAKSAPVVIRQKIGLIFKCYFNKLFN